MTQMNIEALVNSVYSECGVKLPILHDNTEPAEYEIIIGNSSREGVVKTDDRDVFTIRTAGNKVYLNGGSPASTAVAVSEFTRLLLCKKSLSELSVTGSLSESLEGYDDAVSYKPVIKEDFDSENFDTPYFRLSHKGLHESEGNGGRRSIRSDDKDVSFIKDSCFQIHPKYDDEYCYGGMIYTQDRFHFTYGLIEMSARVPDCKGIWTSLWLRCGDQSGMTRPEIDINESFGNGQYIAANMHTWPTATGKENGFAHSSMDGRPEFVPKKRLCVDCERYHDDFHTFGVLWTEESAKFVCDGEVYVEYPMGTKPSDSECFSKHMYIVLSMAAGFASNPHRTSMTDATPEELMTDGVLYTDWIYLWQKNDGKQVHGEHEVF